jgi:hypothetical protein
MYPAPEPCYPAEGWMYLVPGPNYQVERPGSRQQERRWYFPEQRFHRQERPDSRPSAPLRKHLALHLWFPAQESPAQAERAADKPPNDSR